MTVKEALTAAGITPDPEYTGVETADDMILGIQTESTGQETPDLYIVVQEHVTEHSGAVNASSSDTAYIRTGTVTTKTGAQRQITINGERFAGDDFQDFANDVSNAANNPAGFSAQLNAVGKPKEYTYTTE